MISKNLYDNREKLKQIFNNSSDLVLYEFNTLCGEKALVAYIEALVDRKGLYEDLIRPLMQNLISPQEVLSTIFIAGAKEEYDIDKTSQAMTTGSVSLFIENKEISYLFDLGYWDKRQIEESGNERVIRGPKEAFIEDINTNKSLIRRKIRSTKLIFEDYILGSETNTQVSLAYIRDIVNPEILEEVRRRIKNIKLDSILDTGYIEYYIEDSPKSMICTIGNTEKPDIVAGKILEGRVAILCDGSPSVLTVPKVFIENFQMSEDYYLRPWYTTFYRFIRVIALIVAITLPGFLVALKTFHQEMLPTKLLMTMTKNIVQVPFTSLVEALMMILFLELIKESGLRIQSNIGSAVTVISGLVLGQTAVQAGLVGPTMVIVVAASGISEFIVPQQREMIVIYRLIILILGGSLGLFGIVTGMTIMIIHLISLNSFGIPYMYPIAPYDKEGMRDFIFVRSIKEMNYRPEMISSRNSRKRNETDEKN